MSIKTQVAFLLSLAFAVLLDGREWTDSMGRKIEADLVRATDSEVVLKMLGKDYAMPISELSETDREYVMSWKKGTLVELTGPLPDMVLAGKPVQVGMVNNVSILLDDAELKEMDKAGMAGISSAEMTLQLPAGFDPRRSYPVLIVMSAALDKEASGTFSNYAASLKEQGWIGLTVDPGGIAPAALPKENPNAFRWVLLNAAVKELNKSWPTSKTWHYALAGAYGGGESASAMSAKLIKEGHSVIGLYLINMFKYWLPRIYEDESPNKTKFMKMPMIVSNSLKEGSDKAASKYDGIISRVKDSEFNMEMLESKDINESYLLHLKYALKQFAEHADLPFLPK